MTYGCESECATHYTTAPQGHYSSQRFSGSIRTAHVLRFRNIIQTETETVNEEMSHHDINCIIFQETRRQAVEQSVNGESHKQFTVKCKTRWATCWPDVVFFYCPLSQPADCADMLQCTNISCNRSKLWIRYESAERSHITCWVAIILACKEPLLNHPALLENSHYCLVGVNETLEEI